ncbi:VCBS repeat-containing protein [Flavivirga eckloniae]|uniref:ASPIC/UnbV domain-containing protein n=1 Tax=Flavivirga eckloniae TaxID=1803846 RepID=A0A2K9PSD6_9FLAO|nr:VCBS repeat-containing protein [Flavivirga eckloniae]AUP79718.1 hypothetical protein C1H87_13780 [Flavivirga eckloniae]
MGEKKVFIWLIQLVFLATIISCNKTNNQSHGFRTTEGSNKKLFEVLSDSISKIVFNNKISESVEMNALNYEYIYNGAGVSAADFNNDGLVDLYFISNQNTNKLYLNKGNLQFTDVTNISKVKGTEGLSLGVATVDINQDGFLDIYVCKSGPFIHSDVRRNELYVSQGINEAGVPIFKEQAKDYLLDLPHYSTQAAFFDYDKDGDLDMFLINHNTDTKVLYDIDNYLKEKSPLTSDRLFRNDNNKFYDVSDEVGLINDGIGFGLGLSIGDLNNDTWPDVLVSHDYAANDRIYMNQCDGTFKEVFKTSTGHASNFSMGNDIADFNNDGWLDFITLDMAPEDNYSIKASMSGMNPEQFNDFVSKGLHYQYMYNTLQINNGVRPIDNTPAFSDVSFLSGISSTDWSWGPLFFDIDNDGDKDLFVSNGIKRDFRNVDFIHYRQNKEKVFSEKIEEAPKEVKSMLEKLRDENILKRMPSRKKANYFYENKGNLQFQKKNKIWCSDKISSSNGATYADLDNDGDLEIITNNMDDVATIYKNNSRELNLGNFLKVNLKGPKNNLFGIGARVTLKTSNGIQIKEQYTTKGFQSSTTTMLHFGLGNLQEVKNLTVYWPDSKVQKINNIKSNQRIILNHSEASLSDIETLPASKTKNNFKDIARTRGIKHFNHQNVFNDFERERLLPHKMSEDKLALCVGDVNGDGLDDFYVGGASNYAGVLYVQNKTGKFTKTNTRLFNKDKKHEDVDATFFDADNDGDLDLYVVSGGNEFNKSSIYYSDRLYINNKGLFSKSSTVLPTGLNVSGSVVCPHDFDGDGDTDLFVGGRQTPGLYPYAGTSFLLKNESNSGDFKFAIIENKALANIGMVTDAKWEDIDSDNLKELILVGEWMPLTVFKNENGTFKKDTSLTNLDENVGWWFSLESGDFDNDGDIDFVAGNLGLNSKYQASKETPFQVYAKDFDQTGTVDIVLSYNQDGVSYPLRGRECSSQQMPFIKKKFKNYHDFALADLETVYGKENISSALNHKATNFSSSFFENQGHGTFKIKPLVNEAQVTTIKSIVPHDYNKDGDLDLLLFGNLYGFEVETPRQDAGYGIYLEHDEEGFSKQFLEGLFVEGEVINVKKIALEDKGLGLLILRNNEALQLLKVK